MTEPLKLRVVFASSCIILLVVLAVQEPARSQSGASEAPAGFDNQTNGHVSQAVFDQFREEFEEIEEDDEGLGPTFNGASCVECHLSPVVGGVSEVLELRAGSLDNRGRFQEHPGGSLVQSLAVDPAIQEQVRPGEDTTFRSTIGTLGDGFIEAIPDEAILAIANSQPAGVRGLAVLVPVLEANGALRVGRFGWKGQHASLESFSADAYINEMGITSPLQPDENTSDGRSVKRFDEAPDPENDGDDVLAFAEFMRATKVPPRDDTPSQRQKVERGAQVFASVGCSQCHVATFVTAPAGTVINGGALTVSQALGNKIIHPYSDFLLHDIGTSDPIVQNGGATSYNKVRTPALWGLRTRTRLMHDGQSVIITDAIARHGGQAAGSRATLAARPGRDQEDLLAFLGSL
jgi:CxxC motif-containing protein (DUF1111 family)